MTPWKRGGRECHGTSREAGTVYFYTGMPRLGAAQVRSLLEQWPWNRDFAWFQVFFLKSLLNFHLVLGPE